MNQFWIFVGAHWMVVAAWTWMVVTAAGCTMPKEPPRSFADLWHWLFDFIHQFLNLRNQRPTLPG